MAPGLEHLGECDVKAALGGRARAHRDAEAGVAGLRALDGDDEHVLAPGAIGRVGVGAAEQHAVEDSHRVQLARTRAQKRVAPSAAGLLHEFGQPALLVAPRAPQGQLRRQLVALPGVRADGVGEQRLLLETAQPVVTSVLLVGPPGRKIGARGDLVVDDHLIAHRRPDDRVPAARECPEQLVQVVSLERVVAGLAHPCRILAPAGTACKRWAPRPSPGPRGLIASRRPRRSRARSCRSSPAGTSSASSDRASSCGSRAPPPRPCSRRRPHVRGRGGSSWSTRGRP